MNQDTIFFLHSCQQLVLKDPSNGKNKIKKIKEKTCENVSTQNYTQMFSRKPVTRKWHHYILMYSTKNASKAELAKEQHLLPAN